MIPFHLGSEMVSKQLESKLMKNIHICVELLVVMHHNTDKPNIFLIVEQMKDPENSYEDLAFIIKKNLQPGDKCPPKFLVFFYLFIPKLKCKQVLSS